MRRFCCFILPFFFCAAAWAGAFPSGKVIKVLPHLLDAQGRHTLSPSLFDRDAYQAKLRKNLNLVSGLRFDVQWQADGGATATNAVLRVEIRGTAKGQLPSELRLEQWVTITGGSHWTQLKLDGNAFKEFGEVIAWRVTLWTDEELLGEQKSFLW